MNIIKEERTSFRFLQKTLWFQQIKEKKKKEVIYERDK